MHGNVVGSLEPLWLRSCLGAKMNASGGTSPRDWGSQFQGSAVVSSTGLSFNRQVSGSQVSSGSNSSVQGGIQFYQPKDSTKDLKVFSDAITGHLQIVLSCLSEADQDLLSCAVQTENQFVSLVCSAQTVACKLAATACNALEKLPTLLWAARGHGSTELSDCLVGLSGHLGTLRKETQGIRSDYIDLLTQVQYMGHCTQVTVDQTVMSLLPEPSEKEDGSMECQIPPSLALALQEANEESQKYLELTLLHLDYMSQILEECSDFWLMLHQAELQLRKLEKDSQRICDGSGRHADKATLLSFCEKVRSFCGVYSGAPPSNYHFKSHLPVASRSALGSIGSLSDAVDGRMSSLSDGVH